MALDSSHLTVVIPTYNESGNIRGCIEAVINQVPSAQILVVDDNSPDGTGDIVRKMSENNSRIQLLHREKKEGLGRAYCDALAHVLRDSSVDTLCIMDADGSHDPVYLTEMLKKINDADVVIGSRYCAGGTTEGWEPWRKWLSAGGNAYCRFVTGMSVSDVTAGFCMMRAGALRAADVSTLSSSGYAFQMELKYRFWKNNARFAEVPIIFRNRREGESKITGHIVREGLIAPWKMRFGKKV
jgi:dolichol-phosphate mannosyltransferase